jgi:hypothetical protein
MMDTTVELQRSRVPYLVRRRFNRAVDDENFDCGTSRFQLEAELLQSGKMAGLSVPGLGAGWPSSGLIKIESN